MMAGRKNLERLFCFRTEEELLRSKQTGYFFLREGWGRAAVEDQKGILEPSSSSTSKFISYLPTSGSLMRGD